MRHGWLAAAVTALAGCNSRVETPHFATFVSRIEVVGSTLVVERCDTEVVRHRVWDDVKRTVEATGCEAERFALEGLPVAPVVPAVAEKP